MAKKNIAISDDVHKQVSDYCYNQGIVMHKFVTAAVSEKLIKATKKRS